MRGYTWMIAASVALIGFLAVLLTLQDPGLTIDEPTNTALGKQLFITVTHQPDQLASPETVYALWGGAHDHPPLPRFLLGAAGAIVDPQPNRLDLHSPAESRLASAFAFALVLLLVTRFASSIAGQTAGLSAGLSALTMPRLFGQAHLASPEVISTAAILLGLACAAKAIQAWQQSARFPRYIWLTLAGVTLGFALLTKLTAVLLPAAVVVTWFAFARLRAFPPLVVFGCLGIACFLALWPWMWPISLEGYPDGWRGTLTRLSEFLSTGFSRATIYVEYWGRQYPNADGPVPWHYVWIYVLLTVPLLTQLLALTGLPSMVRSARQNPLAALILVQIAIFLIAFTLPVQRYDGERLFLAVFPLWAVVAGVGAASLLRYFANWFPTQILVPLLALASASGAIAIVRLHPFELSYYNALVGGLPGASRRGLEATYWGDSISDELLDTLAERAEPGACAALVPSLFDAHTFRISNENLRANRIAIVNPETAARQNCRWAILYHRGGYLGDPLPKHIMARGTIAYEVARDGVWLSRLYQLPANFSWDNSNDDSSGGS